MENLLHYSGQKLGYAKLIRFIGRGHDGLTVYQYDLRGLSAPIDAMMVSLSRHMVVGVQGYIR
jgi:hypothetical protein